MLHARRCRRRSPAYGSGGTGAAGAVGVVGVVCAVGAAGVGSGGGAAAASSIALTTSGSGIQRSIRAPLYTGTSRTDTSFSLVTIDLDSLTCYVDNYGAGYDREFSLDYKTEPAPVNLFDKNDADVVIGGRFNSSRGVTADQTEALVTGYIPATAADLLHVVTNKANNSTAQVGAAQLYDSGKNYIGIYISPKASQKWDTKYSKTALI